MRATFRVAAALCLYARTDVPFVVRAASGWSRPVGAAAAVPLGPLRPVAERALAGPVFSTHKLAVRHLRLERYRRRPADRDDAALGLAVRYQPRP